MWSARLGRTTVRTLLVILGLALAVTAGYVLWTLRLVVVPLLIALLLAAAISPLVRWLHRRNAPQAPTTWISLLAAVTVLGGVLVVVMSVSSRWNQLTSSSDLGLSRLENLAAGGPLPFTVEQLRQARETAVGYLREHLSVADAVSALSLLTTLVVGLLLVVVMLFFFPKDGRSMWGSLLEPLDITRRQKAVRAGSRALETMGGYVRGITLVALIALTAGSVLAGIAGAVLAVPLTAVAWAVVKAWQEAPG